VRPLLILFLAITTLIACDGLLSVDFDNARARTVKSDGGAQDAGDAEAPTGIEKDVPLIPASKVDLLLVVDNSASMGDKSRLLATSIGTFLRDVVRVGDLHVGVISSSLGNFGGDVCDGDNPRTNDHAYFRTTDENGAKVTPGTDGFLSYRMGDDAEKFIRDSAALVRGVGETGCGLEAQLEAAYRFLVQPDPWITVKLDVNNQADFGEEVDVTILQQRKAFLRPDSALVVLMITEEDDSSADPLSVGGQGWAFMSRTFPGSRVFRGDPKQGTTAPRGTSICATNPASPDCTSCGFQSLCDPLDNACKKIRQDPNCTTSGQSGQSGDGYNGYFAAADDDLNVRFHRMKERFGIDPQYPIARYTDGFTRFKVPDRKSERVIKTAGTRRDIGPYAPTFKCTNPIFAETLPSQPGEEICNLKQSTRSRELVVFALLGGVPEALATANPNWPTILGRDPGAFNFDGIDPHMIQSVVPRPGLVGPSSAPGDTGTDPIHGREWDTQKIDLQYACTFPLATPRTCADNQQSCDCPPSATLFPPLCGASPGQQIRGKAYPTPRPLRVAQSLGDRGVIGSICASQGYDATMRTLFSRLKSRLAL
jgi:hypothetical protein